MVTLFVPRGNTASYCSRMARYTLRFDLRPTDRSVTYTVATGGGVLKAVAMAAGRFVEHDAATEQEQIHAVSVVSEEPEAGAQSDDLVDYWEAG